MLLTLILAAVIVLVWMEIRASRRRRRAELAARTASAWTRQQRGRMSAACSEREDRPHESAIGSTIDLP